MAEKQRQLPPWMARQERGKEKAQTSTTSSREPREQAGRTVFYCMNEKELVEAAISFLTEDVTGGEHAPLHTEQQVNDSVTNCRLNTKDGFTKEKRSVSELEAVKEFSSDGCERTCVSETDLDISEEETLPYTNHQGEQQEAVGQGIGPGQAHSIAVVPIQEGERPEDCSQSSTTADDDALRLIREIFFT